MQIFAGTEDTAERVREIAGVTLHSIGEIARLQRIADNDYETSRLSSYWSNCARTHSSIISAMGGLARTECDERGASSRSAAER